MRKATAQPLALGLHDLAEGDARGVVDADMDELPADAAAVALAGAVAGDAMADLVELAELFDVDVDQLAGPLALVAAGWFGRLQGAQPVEAQALEDAADGGGRDADCRRRSPCRAGAGGAALSMRSITGLRRRLTQPMGPRAAVLQAGQAFLLEAIDPFAPVRGQTPTASLAAFGVCPLRTILTRCSRPCGVRRAFLWMSIRLSQGHVDVSTTSASSAGAGWTTY